MWVGGMDLGGTVGMGVGVMDIRGGLASTV